MEKSFVSSTTQKWSSIDYSRALSNAICQNAQERLLSKVGDKFKFNGFWRNGDKQNVCAWIDKATWHDAKTGEGGGCKEFAKVAFGMDLKDFMDRYGHAGAYHTQPKNIVAKHSRDQKCEQSRFSVDYVNKTWTSLFKTSKRSQATKWLSQSRGIINPLDSIGSGYVDLTNDDLIHFNESHQAFVKERITKGQVIAVPLRSVNDDRVHNLFLRIFSPIDKSEKSRLLPHCGGWGNLNDGLKGFGFPHLINDFPHLILCEGMADYFAAEYLLDTCEKHLPIGAANADALVKWAQYLVDKQYRGTVHFVYQLDSNENGRVTSNEIGPQKALKAAQILLNAQIEAKPFNWVAFLSKTTTNFTNISDLADSLENELHKNECGHDHLKLMFQCCLNGKMP